MKYEVAVTTSFAEFFNAAWTELTNQPQLEGLNALLTELSSTSRDASIGSLENFYRAGGIMAVAATTKKRLVGIATLVSNNKVNGPTWRIEHVVIHPSHRGKGLSRRLMNELIVIARLRGFRRLDLTTGRERVEANTLYRSLGFKLRKTNAYRLEL